MERLKACYVLLFIRLHTFVQLDDVTPDEPDEVREVGNSGLVSNVVEHVLVVHYRGRVTTVSQS